ncbi:MAG: hypothetical protein GXC72_09660 [Chitinophagaceae bacterium]|jgi:hypothetical protein|nr:hypothetical protein [Chitinophagaceae bacterium]
MKKQSVQFVKSAILSTVLSAALFMTAQASDKASKEAAAKVDVKYTGNQDDQISFSVKFNNPEGKNFTLLVLDEYGESLFKRNYNDVKFEKKFKLPKDEVSRLTFLIQRGKEVYRERFDVNVTSQSLEQVVVSKS